MKKISVEDNRVRILSYNVLADCYTSPGLFPYATPSNLAYAKRAPRVISELKQTMADIICLQEVDHYAEFYSKELTKLGYNIQYDQKVERYDGIIIGLKMGKLEAIGKAEVLRYDDLTPTHPHSGFYTGYIGHILPCKVKETNNVLIVCNTHLWALGPEDTRFGQISYLIHRAGEYYKYYSEIFKKPVGVVICGDLNTLPRDETFKRFYNIPIQPSATETATYQNILYFQSAFAHTLLLKSAYEEYKDASTAKTEMEKLVYGHPPHTNFTHNFSGCLDYILYDKRGLKLEKVKKLPEKSEVSKEVGLPNSVYPSDHLSIEAEFTFL